MNSENPLVTVLMPCYNAMQFLDKALASIRNQSYENLEILLIDDGSSDGTLDFVLEQAKLDSRIKVVQNEKNIGLIDTLNKGINLARGEYIARMDADDISHPNRIKHQLKYIQSNNLDVVGCDAHMINEQGTIIKERLVRNVTETETIFASFLFAPLIHPAILAKKSVMVDNPYLKEPKAIHAEDYELWCRLIDSGYHLANLNEILFSFRMNNSSVSHRHEALQKKNFATCARDHYNTYFDKDISTKVYKVVVNRFDSIDPNLLSKALQLIDEMHQHFVAKDASLNEEIVLHQKIDILIGAFKKGGIGLKTVLLAKLLKFGFNPLSRRYLIGKFKAK